MTRRRPVSATAASLTVAQRRLAAVEKARRRRRWARRWLAVGNLWEVAKATRFRYRDQLWPLVILAVLWVCGLFVRGAAAAGVVVTGVVGAGVVVFHLRRRLARSAEWCYALVAVTAALGWLMAVSLSGVRWPTVVGVLAWAGLSLVWWRHHEVRGGSGHSNSTVVNLWNDNVRDLKGSPLAGAELDSPLPFEHGDSHTVHLVRGKQHLGVAQAALPLLETALDTPMAYLVLERHPDYPRSPSTLRLQVITRSPIEHTVYFDRPRHDNGRIQLGPYADGIGEASLRLYTDNSMWSIFLLGGTGTGKTRLQETIAVSVLDMGHTVIFYMDGQNGASSPTLFTHATWAVGTDGALRMLAALERIAAWRQKENRAHGWSGFTPSVDRPGILVIIDEHHRIFPLAGERFADAAREWRKVGISFFAADQDSNLKGFGGEDALRSALLEGNGLVMRVSSRIAGNLIPGLELHPFDLPRMPGYCMLVAAPGSDARTAPFRGRYCPDAKDHAQAEARGENLPVPTIEQWFTRYKPRELDRGARRAAGVDYTSRHEQAREERQQLLAFINSPDTDAESDTTGEIDRPAATADALLSPTPADDQQNMTCARRILALDWDRYREMERAQIIAELPDVNISTLTKALQGLVVTGGPLKKAGHGTYRKVETAGAHIPAGNGRVHREER